MASSLINDDYALFWIVLLFSICIVGGLSKNIYLATDYRDYDRYTTLMWRITRANYKAAMLDEFDRIYNFTELLDWVDDRLEWVPEDIDFKRGWAPFDILSGGKGRCGEHAHLYVAACIAHGYEARIVKSFKPDDHVWAEIKIDGEWMHVDVVDKYWDMPFRRFDGGMNVTYVIAYMPSSYEDVTHRYVMESTP